LFCILSGATSSILIYNISITPLRSTAFVKTGVFGRALL
jgi:hypothetical protein